jgi:hypothetical protein
VLNKNFEPFQKLSINMKFILSKRCFGGRTAITMDAWGSGYPKAKTGGGGGV